MSSKVPRHSRRVFFARIAAASGAIAVFGSRAQQGMVAETDAQAAALGYVTDTNKADKKKYPKHAATQKCNNCTLYTAKPTDATGPCTLFAGKQVAGNGWCSAWVKKG
jgi:hypothetical protein